MKNEISSINIINSPYVNEDEAMVMVPYKDNLTIVSQDGVLYSHKEGSNKVINEYIIDPSKKTFPYHNITSHYERDGFHGKIKYVNQILKYNQPYLKVCDNVAIENYLIRNNQHAYIFSQVLFGEKHSSYLTRKELELLYTNFRGDQKYIIHLGNDCDNPMDKEELPSEIELLNDYDEEYYVKHGNAVIIQFVDEKIYAEYVKPVYIGENSYYVSFIDLPINKYSLNQLKELALNVNEIKKPKIPLYLNPNLSGKTIIKAKKNEMLLKLTK